MVHLSLCGFNAGMLLCGHSREEAKVNGDEIYHAVYYPIEKNRDKICKECLEIWDDCE